MNTETENQKILLKEFGYERSKHSHGSESTLKDSLDIIYANIIKDSGNDKQSINQRIKNAEQKIVETENHIRNKQEEKNQFTNSLKPAALKRIEELKEKINQVRLNGVKIPTDKVAIIITGSLVLLLTVYLVMFYSSALYTILYDKQNLIAQLQKGKAVFAAIFNSQAIVNAARKGVPTLILVLVFPTIFLGLGYLLHKFIEEKKYLALSLFLTITLLFDSIIGYLIAENIHEIKYLARLEKEPWEFSMIFQDVNFYFVIAAGFVVYIIWGYLLHYLLNEVNKNSDSHSHKIQEEEIRQLSNKIEIENQQVLSCEESVHAIDLEIHSDEGEIKKLKKQIEHLSSGVITVDLNELKNRIKQFSNGWKDFLYDYFATKLADQKAEAMNKSTEDWLEKKLIELKTDNKILVQETN